MHPSSNEIYDEFAPYYRHYSDKKSKYLDAIDALIMFYAPRAKHVLDVGCGDGARGARLADKIKSDEFLMIDSSKNMISLANNFRKNGLDVVRLDITDKRLDPALKQNHFDLVLCLWNVLGHITERTKRLQALANIRKVMTDDGMLIIDVSNWYNIAHYGLKTVVKNVWRNFIHPNHDNSTLACSIDIGNKKIPSYCHFFSPGEFPRLCEEAGLKIKKETYVNYKNGTRANKFSGHAFYVVDKKKAPR